jgi:hypothetical protein
MLSLPFGAVDRALIPGPVKAAAALAVAQAGLTGVPSVVLGIAIFEENRWHPATMVLAAQLIGAVLLIVGTVRIVLGGGRSALIAGAGLDLLLCVVYLVFATIVLPRDGSATTPVVIVAIVLALYLAVLPAIILGLALSAKTAEYLYSFARPADRLR